MKTAGDDALRDEGRRLHTSREAVWRGGSDRLPWEVRGWSQRPP